MHRTMKAQLKVLSINDKNICNLNDKISIS